MAHSKHMAFHMCHPWEFVLLRIHVMDLHHETMATCACKHGEINTNESILQFRSHLPMNFLDSLEHIKQPLTELDHWAIKYCLA